MRVSEKLNYWTATRNIAENRYKLTQAEEMVSTGKRINRPSDDPIGVQKLQGFKNMGERLDYFQHNIERGQMLLEGSDSALNEAASILIRAKELTLQSINGTLNEDDRKGAAQEVRGLKSMLTGLANTVIDNVYVFGGYKNATNPFNTQTGECTGDSNMLQVEVGNGVKQAVTANGMNAFIGNSAFNDSDPDNYYNGDTVNIFKMLNNLEEALVNDETEKVRAELSRLDMAFKQINTTRSDMGVKMNRLDISQTILEKTKEDTEKKIKEIEDADIVKVISDFTQYQKTLQSSLVAATKVTNQSILNYI